MEPQSTASQIVTMMPWMTTVFTLTPFLLVLAKDFGRMPSSAVDRRARDGPTIHEEISASTPAARRNAMTYTSQPAWKWASKMAANEAMTPSLMLPSS